MKYFIVNSVKGGCGKTTTSLIWALKQFKETQKKSCIIDTDFLGTEFEKAIFNNEFVGKYRKQDTKIELPVKNAADIYLNDLVFDSRNFDRRYISNIEIPTMILTTEEIVNGIKQFKKTPEGMNKLDIILASPERKDKIRFQITEKNQFLPSISYDAFKNISKKLIKKLKEKKDIEIGKDLSGKDLSEICETCLKNITDTCAVYQNIFDKNIHNYSDDIQRHLHDAFEKINKLVSNVSNMKINSDKISYIINETSKIDIKKEYEYLDYMLNEDGTSCKKLGNAIEELPGKLNKAMEASECYDSLIFDMPPNSDPYSDSFFDLLLDEDYGCFDSEKDEVILIMVSAINRSHIKANQKWLEHFFSVSIDHHWNLPNKIIIIYNNVNDVKKIPMNEDKGITNDYELNEFARDNANTFKSTLKSQFLDFSDKVSFFLIDHMSEYAEKTASALKIDSIDPSYLKEVDLNILENKSES